MPSMVLFAVAVIVALLSVLLMWVSGLGGLIAATLIAVVAVASIGAAKVGELALLFTLVLWREIVSFLEIMGAPVALGIIIQQIAIATGTTFFGLTFLSSFGVFLFNAGFTVCIVWTAHRLFKLVSQELRAQAA